MKNYFKYRKPEDIQKQLVLLKKITGLLKENNIPHFLNYGTLLGAVREGKFLEHDSNDIDLGANQEDYWKVRAIIDSVRELHYKGIWRNEIAVFLEEGCHLDIFFYSNKEGYSKTCAFVANKLQGGVNIESAMIYKTGNIFPLKSIEFCGDEYSIPNNPEAFLEEQYGSDWRTPITKWYHSKVQCFDADHRTIAILIPTFLRDNRMMASIRTIIETCSQKNAWKKWIRIYVGDQGYDNWSKEKKDFYKEIEDAGHKVYKLPFNCGLSYARNYLVKQSKEKYLMIVDDDFKFTENTNLGIFIDILNHKEENGIVGGDITNRTTYHADFVFEKINKDIHLYRIKRLNKKQTVKRYNVTYDENNFDTFNYYYSDIVLNFFLAKREVLEQVPLDNNLKICEHSDHFLRIKKNSNWKVCYCPTVTCEHLEGASSEEYTNFRQDINYVELFFKKWGIRNEKFFHKINETPIEEIDCKESHLEVKKIKIVQIARIPCANSGYELSQLINKYSSKYESKYILGHEYVKRNSNIPYRKFPYELFWEENPEECIKAIKEADIVHIHHDAWDEIIPYLKGKKVVSTLYNLTNALQYSDNEYNKNYIKRLKSLGSLTVADQPLQKIMFSDISTTHVPLIKMLFDYKVEKGNGVRIGFSPTNRMNEGIGSKRYNSVMEVINELKEKYTFEFDLIEGVEYEENIKRKSYCDIIIDDVDDNYEKAHNSTIESALLDAVPLTNYTGDWFPAIKTSVKTLRDTLQNLLENPKLIEEHKIKLHEWRENIYTPRNLISIYEKVYNNISILPKEVALITKTATIQEVFNMVYTILTAQGIKVCLVNKTCLDAIKFGRANIEKNNIYLGVDNLEKTREILSKINTYSIAVHLEQYSRPTKELTYFDKPRNVPFPLLKYLVSKFGRNWRDL